MVKQMTELKFVDYILDNVHGYIALTEIEQKIERLPIFQRLRRIKQLGVANWIFPGAEHTRYSHSLGVMHIADQMAIKLGFGDTDRQLIRLAGMLHDIGHYPLSHSGESAYKKYYKQNVAKPEMLSFENANTKVVKSIESLQNNEKDNIDYISHTFMRSNENEFHHEIIGTKVIKSNNSLKTIISDAGIDIDDICSIITGDIQNERLIKHVQLLHSELDADRIDYLLRDASSSGTSYGTFELNTLIKNLEMVTHKEYGIDIIGVNHKGIASADQFLLNRYFAYSQVVFNKYVSILNFMGESVVYWMLNSNQSYFPDGQKLIRWIDAQDEDVDYLKFTDDYFMDKIRQFNSGHVGSCPDIICKMIEYINKYTAPSLTVPKNENNISVSGCRNEELYQLLKGIPFIQNIEPNRVLKYDEVYITKHVKIQEYVSTYESKKAELDIELEEYLKHRLINGIAVIDKDSENEPCLLVDISSSLIKDLCRHRTIFLRQFDI